MELEHEFSQVFIGVFCLSGVAVFIALVLGVMVSRFLVAMLSSGEESQE